MTKKFSLILFVLLLLLAGMTALSLWLYCEYESPEEIAAYADANRLAQALSDERQQNADLTAERARLAEQLAQAENDLKDTQDAIEELEHKISVLIREGNASDEYQQILLDEIDLLRADAEMAAAEIASLKELIDNYENITTINFGYQAQKISDLLLKLAEPNRPTRTIVTEKTDDVSGETVVTETTVPANISFYYRDITTGYTLSYNSDDVMYSASLIKAPFIYSLLQAVADFEDQRLHYDAQGNPLYDEEGNPLFTGQHPNLDANGNIIYRAGEEKYDLSRIWVFNKKKMTVEGSGILAEAEDGLKMTYLELVQYAILYSDNIAFAQLREMFGYSEFYATVRALGVRGTSSGFMRLSAADCGKFLEAMYTFMEENEKYGGVLKDAMLRSSHNILIPYTLAPIPCAHKYGWDEASYHDMAIVYDEHPYLLVIMTDLDQGGSEVNGYIRDIVRMIHDIHRTFYASGVSS